MDRCPTCGRSASDAYARKDDRGHVIEGCVDAFHVGQHSDPERARWWARPAAQALRAWVTLWGYGAAILIGLAIDVARGRGPS